jgi:hypothetical protein
MCSIPSYASGLNLFMDSLNEHEWIASETPQLSTSNIYTFFVNYEQVELLSDTPLTEGDKFTFAWKRGTDLDCSSANILSPEYVVSYGYSSIFWLGNDEGINGIDQEKEEIHVCWKSNAFGGDPSYSRVALVTGHAYSFVTQGYATTAYINLPEISSIYPSYGSSEFYGTDTQLQFSFGGENVFPASRSGTDGTFGIYRGAIKFNGDIEVMSASILYEITTLSETNIPLLEQGNINCTNVGVCNVTLSTATSTAMAPGEIYFMGFFPNSWSSNVGSFYYLFGDNTNSGNAIYYHMFMSRSFDIVSNTSNPIFGKTMIIEGVNLLSIDNVLAKESMGTIATANWTTKAIKISMRFNGSTCSTSLIPFGSIYLENANDTHITIKNLDLKGCNNGNLFADFEIVRAIKLGIHSWSHERREYQKDVDLGTITCDSSCLSCSGPTVNDCIICATHATDFILDGMCYSS